MELPSDIFLPYLQPPCPCCTSTPIRVSRSQPPPFRRGDMPSSLLSASYNRTSTPINPNQYFNTAQSSLLFRSSPNRPQTPPLPPSKFSLTPQQFTNHSTSVLSNSFQMVPINRQSLMPVNYNNNRNNNKSSLSLQTFKSSHSSASGHEMHDKFGSVSLEQISQFNKNNNNNNRIVDEFIDDGESLETLFQINNHSTNDLLNNDKSANDTNTINNNNVLLTEEMENRNENINNGERFLGIV